ncbi:allantoinase [Amyelois transitella]|uniref:allantoinase n=1 Tax=Amyelois transitella TaxID=680683 RepID=UPI00299077D1|nr:allantoinase [Amyelois transitella]
MAGVIDSHVHVNEPGRTSWEGYVSATQAAAAGGVTTIIDMPLNSIPPTTTLKNLKIKASIAKEEVYVDVGFWGGIIPGNEVELRDMIRAGVVGFKAYLIDSGVPEFPNINPDQLKKVFEVLNGTETVLAFHAEMDIGMATKCNKNNTTNCPDPQLYGTYLESRPDEMELEAVSLIASCIPNTNVHVHIVHVSAEGVVPILEKARDERLAAGYSGWRGGVTAETCHHYLTISAEEIPATHSEFKCSPPIRNLTNKEKLWEYIRDERLDLVTSDHSPSVKSLKRNNFMTAWGGISSIQFDISLFWTQAKARGFGLSTVSHYLSAGPARLCGLQDRKGSIRPRLDADLIFFDPNASFIVTPQIIRYKNKMSPYMNRVLTGKVVATYIRGQLVYADDQVIGGPKGKLLLNEGY